MTSNQVKSLSLAIGIHILLIILMMFLFITTPNPPWKEGLAGGGGGGSIVEFGTVDISQPMTTPVVEQEKNPAVEEEQIMTSETENTVEVNTPKKINKHKPEIKPKKTTPVKTAAPVKLAVVPERRPDENALYKGGHHGNAGSPDGLKAGNGTGGTGNGNGGGDGDGTGPGKGNGTGGGNGTGHGPGDGIGFDLTGRHFFSRPSIDDRSQETGKVIIDIVVDKNGKVISVNGPGRGSTTTSTNLVRKAKEAALRASFSPSPNGVEEQRGTITFNFQVR